MKNFAKILFVLTVFLGVLSTNNNNYIVRGGRVLINNDEQLKSSDNINEVNKPLSFPNPFGGGGATFPGGSGAAGYTGEWFPGRGSNIPGGSSFQGPYSFCSLPGIRCPPSQAAKINNNIPDNINNNMIVGTQSKGASSSMISGSP